MDLDHLSAIVSESARFAAVLDGIDPSTEVPTCPGWSVADLVAHLTQVQTFWGRIVAERLTAPPADAPPDPSGDAAALLGRYRLATRNLAAALDAADPGDPVWTWQDDDQTVGFVRRRQAHEALIHRLDAEAAAGVATAPIDAALASDGVDEVLTVMYGGAPAWATVTMDGPVGLVHASDTDRSWTIRIGRFDGVGPESGTVYAAEPMLELVTAAEPGFTIEGTAADLDAWLWNRPTPDTVAVTGDPGALLTVIRAGVQ